MKQYFFPNKRKNLRPFRADVSIKFHALGTFGAGAAQRNQENSQKIGIGIKQARLNCP